MKEAGEKENETAYKRAAWRAIRGKREGRNAAVPQRTRASPNMLPLQGIKLHIVKGKRLPKKGATMNHERPLSPVLASVSISNGEAWYFTSSQERSLKRVHEFLVKLQ